MTEHATATLVRDLTGFTGTARLYHVDPPATYGWADQHTTDYVVVSATNAPYTDPETYIFPANEAGEVIHWNELAGSFKGGLDHEEALRNAGYSVLSATS